VVVNPSDKFNDLLGMHSDSCNVRGKFLTSVTLASGGGGVQNLLALGPSQLGGRTTVLASTFALYRFKSLVFRIFAGAIPPNGGVYVPATNIVTFGVLDDSSGAEGDAPPSYQSVAELRTSSVVPCNQAPYVREWRQADPKAWYHTFSGSTGSDPRLVYPGVVFLGVPGQGAVVVDVEVDYSIVFKGAVDTALTVALPDYVSVETPGLVRTPAAPSRSGPVMLKR